MRSVKKGDLIFYYHTGDEKQIVGIIKASSSAYSLDKVDIAKSREVAVDVIPSKKLAKPVTLQSIKKDRRFRDFLLVRISRLSVMPVSDEQWELICSMSN